MIFKTCSVISRLIRLAIAIPLTLLVATGCTTDLPVEKGFAMTLSRPDLRSEPNDAVNGSTLHITWLGTASYHIRLGGTAILTDPFYSHHSIPEVLLGKLRTQKNRVRKTFDSLMEPGAIFVGHSHYDHMMDTAAAVDLHDWKGTRIYGSRSVGHILSGYKNKDAWTFREVETGNWTTTPVRGVQYMAIAAEHAPQINGLLLFDDDVDGPLRDPPMRARDFRVGDTFAYLFKLTDDSTSFTIYFAGAATGFPAGFLPDLADIAPVDIAILSVPSWKRVSGYPTKYINHLRPRYIIPAHFNDFFAEERPRRSLKSFDLKGFLREVQRAATHEEFESIILADLDVTVQFPWAPWNLRSEE